MYHTSIDNQKLNSKAIFPASGGRAERIVLDVFQSRGFLLNLPREGPILKLVKFWLSLRFTRANGLTDWSNLIIICFTSYIPFTLNAYVR